MPNRFAGVSQYIEDLAICVVMLFLLGAELRAGFGSGWANSPD